MTAYLPYLVALGIGFVAGLRAMTPPAAIAWAAYLGWLPLTGTAVDFMGTIWFAGPFTLFALVELVSDKLPVTPSRKVVSQFAVRLLSGALCGAAIAGAAGGGPGVQAAGVICGVVGAVLGTYIGGAARGALAKAFGRDLPAALIEDLVAIGGAWLLIRGL